MIILNTTKFQFFNISFSRSTTDPLASDLFEDMLYTCWINITVPTLPGKQVTIHWVNQTCTPHNHVSVHESFYTHSWPYYELYFRYYWPCFGYRMPSTWTGCEEAYQPVYPYKLAHRSSSMVVGIQVYPPSLQTYSVEFDVVVEEMATELHPNWSVVMLTPTQGRWSNRNSASL
jgi:hypothetical protein